MTEADGNILVVDDNPEILKTLSFILSEEYSTVDTLRNPKTLISVLNSKSYDVILLDMNFSAGINTGNEGFFWMREILKEDPDIPVVLITAYGDIDMAVKAMKEGATDFVQKPFDSARLITTIRSAYRLRRSRNEVASLKDRQKILSREISRKHKTVTGNSEAIQQVIKTIRKVAPTEANILIHGENGTGKEVIAREIHRLSARKDEIFITVDLGSISDSLFESEMFGHRKGAFTDAYEDRKGWFEAANGGTMFLDEISNLPLSTQSKLLSAIQNRRIIPVGDNRERDIDVRIITASNKNLRQMIEEGLFREDLYFRINTVLIEVPPLRDRGDDILMLADQFTKYYGKKYDKPLVRLCKDASNKLKDHNWPGNVRELQHVLENAVIMCDNNIIKPEDLRVNTARKQDLPVSPGSGKLEDVEKMAIREALFSNDHNIAKTSKQLGITRKTLYSKIRKYGL